MKLKLATIILSTLFAGAAFADGTDSGTVNHHQAFEGMWEVWPEFAYFSNSFKGDNDPSAAFTANKQTGTQEVIHGEYGINKMMSVGLELGMLNASVTGTPDFSQYSLQNPKVSGMLDPNLFMKGKVYDVAGGVLIYGVALSVGLGAQTQSATGAFNATNGGTSITPNVGWETMLGQGGHLGVNFSYTGYLTDRKIQNSFVFASEQDQTRNGGQHYFLEAYYEKFVLPNLVLAADLNYNSWASTKTQTTGGQFASDDNGNSGFGAAVYGSYGATQTIYIIPALIYKGAADPSGMTHIKSANMTIFSLYADFMF